MKFNIVLNIILVGVILIINFQSAYTKDGSKIRGSKRLTKPESDSAAPIDEDDNVRTIKTKKGLIRGQKQFTLLQKKPYYSFKGIPYGKAPVGESRFKPPQRPESWPEVLEAFEFGNECVQAKMELHYENIEEPDIFGNEDCLFLNVYSPDPKPDANLPVMLYIHGGAFMYGSGNIYGPDFLIDENVIVVTFNYRLGAFGFMSLGTAEYSGNMGMKDQQFALRWVNDNIKHFGGNIKEITLFGHDAGAVSVNYHIMAKDSRHLFQRAITMSGSVFNLWSSSVHNDHLLNMFAFAIRTRYQVSTSTELIKYLKVVDAELLAALGVFNLYVPGKSKKEIANLLWAPVVEEHSKKPFLDKKAEVHMINDKYSTTIDILLGYTSAEFLMFIGNEINDPSLLKPFNDKFDIQLPIKDVEVNYESDEYKNMTNIIRKYYFGEDGQVNGETLSEYTNLLSDIWFNYGIEFTAKVHARKSLGATYFYKFSVDSDLNVMKKLFNATGLPGASHGDDICYLFRCNLGNDLYENLEEDSISMKTIKNMAKLWTNFAKTGNPTPLGGPIEFKQITYIPEKFNYLDITNNGMEPGVHPRGNISAFWTELFRNNYKWLSGAKETPETPVKDEL